VRIEGHTVNKNEDNTPEEPQEYALSVNLSQQRANTVLFYVLRGYDKSTESIEWVQKHITASGHAYSKPILANDGKPDRAKSRRVEFKIRTNNEDLIDAMISISGEKPE
jgi:outer membrane protein OmpA-like peptidoglycan-associated protein